jgi:hypothetical protein
LYSLLSLTDRKFNTAVGAGALLSNISDENTATGAGTLLTNTVGVQNTANGAFALFSNTTGNGNTATRDSALLHNTTANANTATGFAALLSNTTGERDTANGAFALKNNTIGSDNTASGASALEGADLVVRDKEGKPYSLRYDQVNAMLLNEFLKEHKTVQELKSQLQQQEAIIDQQEKSFECKLAEQGKQIEALTSGLQKVSAQVELSKSRSQTALNSP